MKISTNILDTKYFLYLKKFKTLQNGESNVGLILKDVQMLRCTAVGGLNRYFSWHILNYYAITSSKKQVKLFRKAIFLSNKFNINSNFEL